jgi:methylmalonyl-CoA mutase
MDEAIALPTEASARVARNTQLFLQNEAGLCKAVDPWHGSRMMEDLTRQMVEQADALIAEIDEAGGMSSAIEQGIPKLRIEAAAAKKQARIDRGQDRLIGVNLFVLEEEEELATLEIDQSAVRLDQERRIQHVKANRSTQKANAALQALTRGAKEDSNLLDLAVKAARSRATLGEISLALEEVYGRFKPKTQKVSGIFSRAMEGQEAYQAVVKRAESFAAKVGRQPRILVAKMGQDGHDRGAKVVASSFADLGFDVDLGALFQTPEEVAKQAVDNDVHVVGISTLAAGHKTLVPALITALNSQGRDDILVVVGGVIPVKDYEALFAMGAVGIFGPGTPITKSASEILDILLDAYA